MRAPAAGVRWLFAFVLAAVTGCPSPRHPTTPPAGSVTLAIGRDGASLRGVAADPERTYVAFAAGERSQVEARRGATVEWRTPLAGQAGPLATSSGLVVATLGGHEVADVPLRGEPGGMLVALDAATGAVRWKLALDASEWSVIAAIAATPDGVVAAGTFSGTLRAAGRTVSSAGKADGFVARVSATGEVAWLVRMGGPGVDGIHGVAAAADRIAIAGTFAAGADLLGATLEPFAPDTPRTDGFVAELDGRGARRWSQSFGGKLDDSVAGVAIDGRGRVAVAASVREVTRLGSTELVARGDADGAIAWWSADGVPGPTVQLGGPELDGVRAITAVGDVVVVGGVFSGTLRLDTRALQAGGGDDAFVAAFDHGAPRGVWHVTGDGREELVGLAAIPGGFVVGVTHTARVAVDGAALPAPRDPLAGAAIVIRPLR